MFARSSNYQHEPQGTNQPCVHKGEGHEATTQAQTEREMCPWAISIMFWCLSVQHIVSELLCAKQAKSVNHITRYVSRLSNWFLYTNVFV
jgi:hypothetical protein